LGGYSWLLARSAWDWVIASEWEALGWWLGADWGVWGAFFAFPIFPAFAFAFALGG
jgi:hypothetical protein